MGQFQTWWAPAANIRFRGIKRSPGSRADDVRKYPTADMPASEAGVYLLDSKSVSVRYAGAMAHNAFRILLASLCLLIIRAPCMADASVGLLDPKVRSYIQGHIDDGFTNGVAIGILKGERTEIHSFGRVSPNSHDAPDSDSVYQIASLTKVFNGVLLALFVERGLLSLHQRLPGSFEECQLTENKGRQITLLDLATHRSGLPSVPDNLPSQDPLNPLAGYTPQQLCAYLSGALPHTEPTERARYSNVSMGLLGRIMAERVDLTWEELFLREIALPLGMESTAVTLTPEMHDRLILPFDRGGMPMKVWNIPTIEGAGALKSTVRDLLLFLRANFEERGTELGRALILAREAPSRIDRALAYQGLGWFLRPRDLFYEHTGGTAYSSYFGLQMDKEIGVVVLSNISSHLIKYIGLRTLRALARR